MIIWIDESAGLAVSEENWKKIRVVAADIATFMSTSMDDAMEALQQSCIQERNTELSGLIINDDRCSKFREAINSIGPLEPRSFNNRGPRSYDQFIPDPIGRKKHRKSK